MLLIVERWGFLSNFCSFLGFRELRQPEKHRFHHMLAVSDLPIPFFVTFDLHPSSEHVSGT